MIVMAIAQHYILNDADEAVPVDRLTWEQWFTSDGQWNLAFTKCPGGEVSTVFLGVDHSCVSGPPLIFGTMVFGGNHANYCERYATKAEAMAGHARIVQMVQDTIFP
jgi:hypothetical protein